MPLRRKPNLPTRHPLVRMGSNFPTTRQGGGMMIVEKSTLNRCKIKAISPKKFFSNYNRFLSIHIIICPQGSHSKIIFLEVFEWN